MRLTEKELSKIKLDNDTDTIWSFSRFDCYRNSRYEFLLRYIKHEEGKAEMSPYGCLGSACHSILEKLYNNEIEYKDMAEEFDNEYSTNISLLDLKFNRSDEAMNQSIAKKYYEDLVHFYSHYKPWNYKVQTERAVTIKVAPQIVFVGYIDAIHKDENGDYWISDFKTSSLYRGNAIAQHAGQLVLYAMGLHQMGVPLEKIHCQWNFLRYVNIDTLQKNGKFAHTVSERREIGQKCKAKAKIWLKTYGFSDDEIDEFANEMLVSNSIDCLPDEVKEKFTIEDCYVEVENWQDIWEELKEEIIKTIDEINRLTEEYNLTGDDKLFWDDDEKLKSQSYYLSNLSDYKISQLKDYANYLERQEAEKEASEDLLGVGKKIEENDDMAWLNEI